MIFLTYTLAIFWSTGTFCVFYDIGLQRLVLYFFPVVCLLQGALALSALGGRFMDPELSLLASSLPLRCFIGAKCNLWRLTVRIRQKLIFLRHENRRAWVRLVQGMMGIRLSFKCQFVTWWGIVRVTFVSLNKSLLFCNKRPFRPRRDRGTTLVQGIRFQFLSLTGFLFFWFFVSGGVTGDRFPVDNN